MLASAFIAATAARTPLGLSSAPSAAAVRAEISRLGSHPFMIDRVGSPMRAALDARLPADLPATERIVQLALAALPEACVPLIAAPPSSGTLPLYLGLPEFRPGFDAADVARIKSALAAQTVVPIRFSELHVISEGHAAGLCALHAASHEIARGAFDLCLVGGADSYFHADTMEWLDANKQLAGEDARSAFVPGEGAGFCLLASQRGLRRLQTNALAAITASAITLETKLIKTEDVCLGEGLTQAVQQATRGLPPGAIAAIICDMNSERYRGEEWGFVCLRVPEPFRDPSDYIAPADCWGDMGAASGPLFAMLACQAAARSYARGPRALLWASSEQGKRAAVLLETSTVG